ncbi:MAG: FG-GAP repeat protein, partial [Candidatus Omnitrophica bacterium]|nr:FG-GAP repeat protein [Candidatus Omnitrophota bacterium]
MAIKVVSRWRKGQAAICFSLLLASVTQCETIVIESPDPIERGRFGTSISVVPDLTEDGVDEFIVGQLAGGAYVFDGSSRLLIHRLIPPTTAARYFGSGVTGIPDLSGDGVADLAVGAHWENFTDAVPNAGRVYVYNGMSGNLMYSFFSPSPEAGSFFGYSLAGVPDLDGDGLGDLVVGAQLEKVENTQIQAG